MTEERQGSAHEQMRQQESYRRGETEFGDSSFINKIFQMSNVRIFKTAAPIFKCIQILVNERESLPEFPGSSGGEGQKSIRQSLQ